MKQVIEAREKWEKKKVQDAKWAKEDKVKMSLHVCLYVCVCVCVCVCVRAKR
jgi:hypothetical protein